MTKDNWSEETVTIVLTRKEMFELAGIIAENNYSEIDYLQIKDKKIRNAFEKTFKKRKKLWLKINRVAQRF